MKPHNFIPDESRVHHELKYFMCDGCGFKLDQLPKESVNFTIEFYINHASLLQDCDEMVIQEVLKS